MSEADLQTRVDRLEGLHRIGLALGRETNPDAMLELILDEARKLCNADGGSLYLRTHEDTLAFEMVFSETLGIHLGGTSGNDITWPALPLIDEDGTGNHRNVATHAALTRKSSNIPDIYQPSEFDFSGPMAFDERNNYRSQSFLTVPLLNGQSRVIGVLQLINARDAAGATIPFSEELQSIVEALAAQAAITLDNRLLLQGQKDLLESFIKLIASAIDAKSPHTGAHCERVPVLTEMLTKAACESKQGSLADFNLSEEEWYELRIAAWLHDCGKVTTPVHVIDKATKLETIFDRVKMVRLRYALLESRIQTEVATGKISQAQGDAQLETLREEWTFIERANIGGEFLPPEAQDRISKIAERHYELDGTERPVLEPDEVENLRISRGTLTEEERLVINGHMVHTIKMLEALPFPRDLRKVPEYAGGHHERMNGHGYPRGLYAGDMSVPARIMAIADVFEALTAQDRPYKKGKTLSETMRIMGHMKRGNHLDPELFDLFVSSGVYREYGARYLPKALIDEVDEAALLAIEPESFELPPEPERARRWERFLPEYA